MAIFLIESFLRAAPTLLLVAGAAMLAERSGVAALHVEGALLVGALSAAVAASATHTLLMAVVGSILGAVLTTAVHGLLVVRGGVNAFASGLTLNTLAFACTALFVKARSGTVIIPVPPGVGWRSVCVPGLVVGIVVAATIVFILRRRPSLKRARLAVIIGSVLIGGTVAGATWPTGVKVPYSLFVAVVLFEVLAFTLNSTRWGARVRAAGDSTREAEGAGIDVERVRLVALLFGAILCGVAGSHVAVGLVSFFRRDMTAGMGYLAIGAVVVGGWRAVGVRKAVMMFATLQALQPALQQINVWPTQFAQAFPFLIALAVLCTYRRSLIAPRELGREGARSSRRAPNGDVTIILAVARRNDHAINEYTMDWSKRGRKKRPYNVTLVGPCRSLRIVEAELQRHRQSTHIVGLGTFLEPSFVTFASRMTESSLNPRFGVIDGSVALERRSVVSALWFDERIIARPAGYLAAAVALKLPGIGNGRTILFIGGANVPVVDRWEEGFRSGIEAYQRVHPDASVTLVGDRLGDTADAFRDGDRAKTYMEYHLRLRMRPAVVVQACGEAGIGVLDALANFDRECRQNNGRAPLVICCDFGEWDKIRGGDLVVASVVRRIDRRIDTWVIGETFDQEPSGATAAGPAWNEQRFGEFEVQWQEALQNAKV